MIAVISDLHFEEEASDVIRGPNGEELRFRRNLDPRVFTRFVVWMAGEAQRHGSKEFELIIAGDLFDLSRTALWFEDPLRPYVTNGEFSPELERKILRIVDAVAVEPAVAEAIESFHLLAEGVYREADGGEPRPFPCKTKITLLAGNHDRIIDGSDAIRARIRELLGLPGGRRFPRYALLEDPETLIRHGHEYDPSNFAADLTRQRSIPLDISGDAYDRANFGDFVTIDVAMRLPFLLRRHYGDDRVCRDPVLRSLYLRLLQFDDVRPQSSLLDYLLDPSDEHFTPDQAWDRLVPVILDLLDEIHDNKFFRYWLERLERPWAPAELELARGLLKLGGWGNAAAREASRKIAHYFLGGEQPEPQLYAAREEVLQENKVRLVISGHTHFPLVTLLKSDASGDRFYINTGTWRSVIPSTPDRRTFGRMRALTYVLLFAKEEQQRREGKPTNSFDYWSGFARDW
ncbi:MAG TPA: hypothetical protein VFU76_15630 [Terriglobales bacterium]|nr:hypothetical protein [Terriglobales bacterium]